MAMTESADPTRLAADPNEARRCLARFSGLLKVHAAMENEGLYPRLLAETAPPAVRAKATELRASFGPVYDAALSFSKKWLELGAMENAPSAYASELGQVLRVLGARISRESAELHPLVDALDA